MTGPEVIEVAVGDPRLVDFTGLTDVALRRVREPAEGLFLAEGEKTIRRALAAGFEPRAALLERRWLASLLPALGERPVPVLVADEAILREVTGFRLHRGALVSFRRPVQPTLVDLVAAIPGAAVVAVLEDLVDHTNVGAVFRNAAALGVDAVVLSPGCADPLYRRSIKVSMGTVFAVPWCRADLWPEGLDTLRDNGFELAALTPDAGSIDIGRWPVMPRRALLLGTEGDGLSRAALARSDIAVRIPMAGGVDSLNVAAASAIAFHEATRDRAAARRP